MNTQRRTFAALAAASFAALASLPSHAFAKEDADGAAIRQTLQRYEQALNKADTAAIVALYAADGVQMAPDAPAAVGRDALKAAYDATFKAISLNLSFTVDELKPLGKGTALLRTHSKGTLKVLGGDLPAGPSAFKELWVLRKQADGQWKVSHYSFSTAPVKP